MAASRAEPYFRGGCEELLLLVLGIQQTGGGVAHAAQGVIEVFIGALAQRRSPLSSRGTKVLWLRAWGFPSLSTASG